MADLPTTELKGLRAQAARAHEAELEAAELRGEAKGRAWIESLFGGFWKWLAPLLATVIALATAAWFQTQEPEPPPPPPPEEKSWFERLLD